MNDPRIPGIEPDLNRNAVRLYGEDDSGMEDFPVLKAFQQYIDSEQAKARKRLLFLGIFFGILMGAIIAVFVVLLMEISNRNQVLNDRLVEYVMKDRERQVQQPPVVVQPPVQQDGSTILALTTKLEEMQKKIIENQQVIESERERARKAAEAAEKAKTPSAEETEIERLKALLKAERDRNEAELKKKKEAELEEYRRKHYPELYEKPLPRYRPVADEKKRTVKENVEDADVLADLDDILDEKGAISYFDDDEPRVKKEAAPSQKPVKPVAPVEKKAEPKKYQIPVEVKGSTSSWRLP